MTSKDQQQLPLLELDLLKTLVAIVETGNFSAAAEAVHRTPSAVSMQVKKLEELVERPLFNRDSRSVSATEDGEILLQHARRVLALNREIVSRFIQPEVAGVVRLGAANDVAERTLPDLLRRFAETHCCVTVNVVVDCSDNIEKRIRQNKLDLALITCNPYLDIPDDVEIVFRERLVWAGAKNGIVFESNPIPISVWDETCSWRSVGLESLEKMGREYRVAFLSSHIAGQRAAILADLAVAPIPVSSCINGIVELGEAQGLPRLKDYALGLMIGNNPAVAVLAAADHLRASLANVVTA